MDNRFREGERVYFRPLELSDLDLLQGWVNDPEIHQYLARVLPINKVREREWIEGLGKSESDVVFGVALKDGDRLVGSCGLHRIQLPNRSAELGILIGDRAAQNRGLGSEAMRLLCAFGFDSLGLHRIELRVYAYNPRAIRCYEKCGFRVDGLLREGRFWAGQWHDILVMSLLEHEWRSARAEEKLAGCALQA